MLRTWGIPIASLAVCAFCHGPGVRAQDPVTKPLIARGLDSGFELSNGTFNGMLAASDGKIYYVLCAESIDTGAQMYSYDPVTEKIEHLGDLTEASGEKGLKSIPQGKSHVNFVESHGKLYFSTHVDWYSVQGGLELMATPPRIQALSRRPLPRVRYGIPEIREPRESAFRPGNHLDEYGYKTRTPLRSHLAVRLFPAL